MQMFQSWLVSKSFNMIKIEISGFFLLPRIRTRGLGSRYNHPDIQFHTDNLKIELKICNANEYRGGSAWAHQSSSASNANPPYIWYKLYISLNLDAFCLIPNASTDTINIIFTAQDTFQLSLLTFFRANQVQLRDTKFFLLHFDHFSFRNLRAFGQEVDIIGHEFFDELTRTRV